MTERTKFLLGLTTIFAVIGLLVRLVSLIPPPPPLLPATPTQVAKATPSRTAEPATVKISILTTTTKAEWLRAVTQAFTETRPAVSGRPVEVEIREESGPEDSEQKVLAGTIKPILWSSSDISGIEMVNQTLRDRGKPPLVSGNLKDKCPSVIYVPTGFAMWRPMAEALGWPDKPISWKQIIELSGDPRGWARYGHSEWGQFTFGHSQPEKSSTGFAMLASLAYAATGKTVDLTPEDVKSDAVKTAFRKVELNTFRYGISTTGLVNPMMKYGPSYLHAAMASETALLYPYVPPHTRVVDFPLVFIFPAEGTFWMDNPTCILEVDWVSAEQREAATLYRNHLLSTASQKKAVEIGLRPVVPGIPVYCPICLKYGADTRISRQAVPPLEPVSGETKAAIIDVFKETRKKSTVVLLLDTSGSMEGLKITNAISGSVEFLGRLDRNDEIHAYIFNDTLMELKPGGRVGDVKEELSKILPGVYAKGSTVLNDAVCTATVRMAKLKAEDEASGEPRLYGIVLLSDGKDENSKTTETDMLRTCIPRTEDGRGVKIFTIGYGSDADKDLLTRIANRTNGNFYIADPGNIQEIYDKISAEQ